MRLLLSLFLTVLLLGTQTSAAVKTADGFLDFHGTTSVGDTVDATLLGNNWRSPSGSWSMTGSGNMIVGGGPAYSCFYGYSVSGTTYTAISTRSARFGLDAISKYAAWTFSATHSGTIVLTTWVKIGDPRAQNQTIDIVELDNPAGGFFIAKLSGIGQLQAHGDKAGAGSQIGTPFNIPLNHWVVLTMVAVQHGTCTLYAHEPLTWTQIGSSSVDQSIGYDSPWSAAKTGRCDAHGGSQPGADQYNEFAYTAIYFGNDSGIGIPQSPGAPTSPSAAAASTTSNNISWSVADTKEEGFRIYRALHGGAFAQVGWVTAGSTSWTDTGLQSGVQYDYYVTAYNVLYESSASSTVSATTNTPTTPQPILARRGI